MKIIVNWAFCDGNGYCAKEAPKLFALEANGTLRVLQMTVSDELRAQAEAAVRSCPKAALSLDECDSPEQHNSTSDNKLD
jgi:ferredoxin